MALYCFSNYVLSIFSAISDKLRKGQLVETKAVEAASVLVFKADDFTQFVETLEPQQVSMKSFRQSHKITLYIYKVLLYFCEKLYFI